MACQGRGGPGNRRHDDGCWESRDHWRRRAAEAQALAEQMNDEDDVLAARNADEAIGLLSSGVAQVDDLFSDVQMPGRLDGFGLARWVRQQKLHLPIILSTGYMVAPAPDAAHLHNVPLLQKPYRLGDLEEYLQKLTHGRRR